MITVIRPDNRLAHIKRIGELERTIQFYQQDRRYALKERAKWLDLFQEWVDMCDLPHDHIVQKILKSEYSGDV